MTTKLESHCQLNVNCNGFKVLYQKTNTSITYKRIYIPYNIPVITYIFNQIECLQKVLTGQFIFFFVHGNIKEIPFFKQNVSPYKGFLVNYDHTDQPFRS